VTSDVQPGRGACQRDRRLPGPAGLHRPAMRRPLWHQSPAFRLGLLGCTTSSSVAAKTAI